jgi:C4-dicarboxylate transporter DctM subunit
VFEANIAVVLLVGLLVLVLAGVHIAIALGMTSALGIYLVTGGNLAVVQRMLASTAYEALRDYVFAVIPLFMLMGEFVARSGAVTDIYKGINRGLRRLPGRLALATVLGNALFSFVTGVSIASAAAFSRISYPEMKRHGYDRAFALGTVAGSSCLGMLIPPSVLMIVWGILTEQSIGKLFSAGVIPGLMVTALFCVYIFAVALLRPELVGGTPARSVAAGSVGAVRVIPAITASPEPEIDRFSFWVSTLGILIVVVTVLGGIWLGFFTPTEGAGAGAFIALLFGILKGMRARDIVDCVLTVGRTSAPILILLITASLYSRTLAMTGVTNAIQNLFLDTGWSPVTILLVMILIWFVLGTIIDSISIMLLTVIIFHPIAVSVGFDPIAFAIIGILAIEAGLLTPPFGILVFTVKAAIDDRDISIWDIFRSSIPYWIVLLISVGLIALFPSIATVLPNLLFG